MKLLLVLLFLAVVASFQVVGLLAFWASFRAFSWWPNDWPFLPGVVVLASVMAAVVGWGWLILVWLPRRFRR